MWKTTDAGRTWEPIFDGQPTGSIGAIAVAPADPNVIYAGTGEAVHRPDLSTGNGLYKSTDGGRTWTHAGLPDSRQIADIAIDARDPQRIFVAVPGHPYGPNAERGVFRSTDGARTFERVLYGNDNTGAAAVTIDPVELADDLRGAVGIAADAVGSGHLHRPGHRAVQVHGRRRDMARAHRRPAGPRRRWPAPDRDGDRAEPAAAALRRRRRRPARRAVPLRRRRRDVDAAAGSTRLVSPESAITVVTVDPRNPDVVFAGGRGIWKSTDGGATFAIWRSAQAGEEIRRSGSARAPTRRSSPAIAARPSA